MKFGERTMEINFLPHNGLPCNYIIGRHTCAEYNIQFDWNNSQAVCWGEDGAGNALKFIPKDRILAPEANPVSIEVDFVDRVVEKPETERNTKNQLFNLIKDETDNLLKQGHISEEDSIFATETLLPLHQVFGPGLGRYNCDAVSFRFNVDEVLPWPAPNYRPSQKIMLALKKEINRMLNLKLIRPSNTEFINAVLVRIKKSGEKYECA